MEQLLQALAFLTVSAGITAPVAVILIAYSIARKNLEIAYQIKVQSLFHIARYNYMNGLAKKVQSDPRKAPPKGPNVYPLRREKDGPRKDDEDPC